MEAVDSNLTNVIISSRNQEEKFENREKEPERRKQKD